MSYVYSTYIVVNAAPSRLPGTSLSPRPEQSMMPSRMHRHGSISGHVDSGASVVANRPVALKSSPLSVAPRTTVGNSKINHMMSQVSSEEVMVHSSSPEKKRGHDRQRKFISKEIGLMMKRNTKVALIVLSINKSAQASFPQSHFSDMEAILSIPSAFCSLGISSAAVHGCHNSTPPRKKASLAHREPCCLRQGPLFD